MLCNNNISVLVYYIGLSSPLDGDLVFVFCAFNGLQMLWAGGVCREQRTPEIQVQREKEEHTWAQRETRYNITCVCVCVSGLCQKQKSSVIWWRSQRGSNCYVYCVFTVLKECVFISPPLMFDCVWCVLPLNDKSSSSSRQSTDYQIKP